MLNKIKNLFFQSRNLLLFSALGIISRGLGAVLPLVVAKIFIPAQFASYSLTRMILFLFMAITISSLQKPFIILANKEYASTGKISKSFTIGLLFLITSIIIFGAYLLIFPQWTCQFAKLPASFLPILFLTFVSFSITGSISGIFLGLGQRIKSVISELIFNIVTTAIIIYLYFTDSLDFNSAFTAYFYSALTIFVYFLLAVKPKELLPLDFDCKHLKKMIHFTKWMALGVTATYMINWGDNFVLRYFINMSEIGQYNFAYQISKTTMFLIGMLYMYFVPFISQNINDHKKIIHLFQVKRPIIIITGFISLAVSFFVIPILIAIVYGHKYDRAIGIFQILIISNFITLYTIFFNCLLDSIQRYVFVNVVTLVQILVNVILNLIMIPIWGITGAAIATVIAYFLRAVLMRRYYHKHIKQKLTADC